MSGANGFVETTERLIQQGASVKATDKRGYTPALACAPNDNVATCLATILMEELKLTDVDVRTSLCSLGKIFTPPVSLYLRMRVYQRIIVTIIFLVAESFRYSDVSDRTPRLSSVGDSTFNISNPDTEQHNGENET